MSRRLVIALLGPACALAFACTPVLVPAVTAAEWAVQDSVFTYQLAPQITLCLVQVPFDSTAHVIEYYQDDEMEWRWISLIDGKPVYGTDGQMPSRRLRSGWVDYRGERIPLDVSAMYDALETPSADTPLVDIQPDGLCISATFSDGAAIYEAVWLIARSRSFRAALLHRGICRSPGRR